MAKFTKFFYIYFAKCNTSQAGALENGLILPNFLNFT